MKDLLELYQNTAVNKANCVYSNIQTTDGNKSLTYTSNFSGSAIAVVSGGSRNKNQAINISCTSTSKVTLLNSNAKNWGNEDGAGWTCLRSSVYFIENVLEGTQITATGAAYTGFPVFMFQIIRVEQNIEI